MSSNPLISCIVTVGYLLFFTGQTTPTYILLTSFTLFPRCQELREVNLQWIEDYATLKCTSKQKLGCWSDEFLEKNICIHIYVVCWKMSYQYHEFCTNINCLRHCLILIRPATCLHPTHLLCSPHSFKEWERAMQDELVCHWKYIKETFVSIKAGNSRTFLTWPFGSHYEH